MRSEKTAADKRQIINYRKAKVKHYSSMYLVVAQSFDKAILGLSTFSLGFTFTLLNFIKKDKDHLVYRPLLELSWIGFILAIIFVVFALILTEKYAQHREKYHSYKILRSKIKVTLKQCGDKWIANFQYLSALCFIGALILFSFFVYFNI